MKFEGIAATLTDALQAPAGGTEPVPGDGKRRCAGHAPAGDGGGRHGQWIAAFAAGPLEQQRHRAPALGGELQPAGRSHRDAPDLTDDGAETAVTQPLFHQRQHLHVVARLRIEDARRLQSGLIESRREQVAGADHPQHRSPGTRRDPGDEQRRRRVVAPARPFARDLVQRVQPQPAVAQPGVERADAERQHRATAMTVALDGAERFAQLGKGRGGCGHDSTRTFDVLVSFQ